MKEELIEILCCPVDKHELELETTDQEGEEIVAGELVGGFQFEFVFVHRTAENLDQFLLHDRPVAPP